MIASGIVNDTPHFSTKKVSFPRASSIDSACMRMHVLMSKFPEHKKKEAIDFNSRLVFAWGDALHNMAQNTDVIFKDDYRRGWWRCTACNTIQGFGKPPSKVYTCKTCNARREAIVYHEHFMEVNDPWYLTGHMDLLLETEENVLTINELKSIAKDGFKKLDAPKGEHVQQVTSYMMGGDKDKSKLVIPKRYERNTDFAYITYISKEALDRNTKAYKVFKVRRNPIYEGIIQEKLDEFKEGYDNFPKKLPAGWTPCFHNQFTSYTSRACPALKLCRKYFMEGM